jgi:hypothetical protein
MCPAIPMSDKTIPTQIKIISIVVMYVPPLMYSSMLHNIYIQYRRFEAVDKRFEAVFKRFEAVDKRFDKVDSDAKDLKDWVGVVVGGFQRRN